MGGKGMAHRYFGRALICALSVSFLLALGMPKGAGAWTVSESKTYWHKVGNDRFRAYDVGKPKSRDLPWSDLLGYPTYALFKHLWVENRQYANRNYSREVDWPVTFIFRNDASINKVKQGLGSSALGSDKLDSSGSKMFLSLSDSLNQALQYGDHGSVEQHRWWDEDGGVKEVKCSGLPQTRSVTNHIRLYADSRGSTPGTRDDRLYNPYWGFYVLGTTHKDVLECNPFGGTWFGKSEAAENHIADLAKRVWGAGGVAEDGYNMDNYEQIRTEGDNHKWENNGRATVVRVGPMASAAINPPDDDPNPDPGEGGEGEEGPPPPNPAIDSDVNGDDHADIVALHTSGVAHTYNATDAAIKETPFGGGMNSALFDNSEHHVVDVSDVNGDHHADLITLCFKSPIGIENAVCVFPGQGDNSFGSGILARGEFVPGTHGPNGHEPIGVADVTGDGRGDLVSFYAPQGNFYVYPGLENGQFGDGLSGGGGQVNSGLFDRQGTYFLDVADVNGDGHADVTGLSASGTAQVFPGTPWGIHQSPQPVGPSVDPIMDNGTGHEPIGVADVNKDGKADLVTLNPSGSFSVYAGMQSGDQYLSSTAVTSHSGLNSSLLDETGDDFVGLLDRTGDGHADLIKVNSEGTIYSASGQGDLKFGSFSYFRNGVVPNRFAKAGYEQVFEKPFIRRIGCQPAGCIDRPRAVESDVDSDLRSDLVTLDTAGTSHTYRALGEVGHKTSFSGTMNSALFDGSGHHVIDVADVTGDWRADKVALHDNGNVYVYPGKFDGTFDSGVASFSGSMKPGPHSPEGFEPIAVADVTGDTLADLVAFKGGQGVKLYPGNANGSFGAPIVSLPGSNSARFDQSGYHFLDVVDVTGDRRGDLVASGAEDDTVRVFKGNTNGTFVLDGVANLPLRLDEGPGQELVGLGDVNGDHRADLATLVAGTVNVYEGRASGEFATEDAGGPEPAGTSFSGALNSNLFDQDGDELVGLLDENGDRRMDLVSVRSDGSARAYHGKANFTFNPTPVVRSLSGFTPGRFNKPSGHEVVNEKPAALRAGCTPSDCPWPLVDYVNRESDVDRDYRSDLVSADLAGVARVFPGRRSGFLTESVESLAGQVNPALLDGKGHYLVDVADVDDNGNSDLITVKAEGKVLVHPGKVDRTFGAALDTGISLPPVMNGVGQNEPIAVADVTGDGFDDLVVFVGPGSGSIKIYKGQSDGKFGSSAVTSLDGALDSALIDKSGHYFLDVSDVTGDGLADLVSLHTNGTTYLYKGQSDGKLATAVSAASIDPIMDDGTGQEPVGLGDVTGDGRADLLSLDGQTLKLRAGQANGAFAAATNPYASPIDSSLLDDSGQELLGLLDYDYGGDDHADLVALENGDLLTYKGKADATFDSPIVANGDVPSIRNDETGHEFVLERPFIRRAGCTAGGCKWLQRVVDSDVTGDGYADLITVDTDGTAHAFKGTPSGIESQAGVPSLVEELDPALYDGSGKYFVDVADVDGDGYSDLTTLSTSDGGTPSGELSVYPGSQSGSLQPPIVSGDEVDTGLHAQGDGVIEPIGVADVTGDRRGDFVAFDSASGKVVVHRGRKQHTYGPGVDWGNGSIDSALFDGTGHYFLDVADISGDGHADLVTIASSQGSTETSRIRIFAGNWDGTFDEGVTARYLIPIVMEDGGANIDIDGHVDGSPGWEPVGLSDVDGDGHADLILHRGYSVHVLKGESDLILDSMVTAHTGGDNSNLVDRQGVEFVGALDTNGDGRGDLVSVDDEGVVQRHLGQSDAKFDDPETWLANPLASGRFGASPGHEMAAEKPFWRRDGSGCTPMRCQWRPQPAAKPADADVDGDDQSDLVTFDAAGEAHVYPADVQSLGNPEGSALLDDSGVYTIDVADVDGDGYGDLITADNGLGEPFASKVEVHLGTSSGAFESSQQASQLTLAINGSDGKAEPIAVSDVTGDGRADFVYLNHHSGRMAVLKGRSTGTFGPSASPYMAATTIDAEDSALLDGSGSYFLDVTDVNGDGRGDLVRWDAGSGEVRVNHGGFRGEFDYQSSLLVDLDPIMDDGEGHEWIDVADVNGDGAAEWVSLAPDGSVLVDWGAGSVEALEGPIDSSLSDGSGVDLVGVLDTNGDGRGDLVSVQANGTVLRSLGNLDHTFDEPEEWFGEDVSSKRINPMSGEEIVNEQALWRRAGCSGSGCDWPPFPVPTGPIGNVEFFGGEANEEGMPNGNGECYEGCKATLAGEIDFGATVQMFEEEPTTLANCQAEFGLFIEPAVEGVVNFEVQEVTLSTLPSSPATCGEGGTVSPEGLPWSGEIRYFGHDFFQAEIQDAHFSGGALYLGQDWEGPLKLALDVMYHGEYQPSMWIGANTGDRVATTIYDIAPGAGIFIENWIRGSLTLSASTGLFLEAQG